MSEATVENPRRRLSEAIPQRSLRARYDAAQTTDQNRNHWAMADSLSATAACSPVVRRTLRNRAGYEIDNNSYLSGMLRTFACEMIGTGPQLQMQSGDDESDAEVEVKFWEWYCEADIAEKLRTNLMAQVGRGEGFGLFISNPRNESPVKLDVRLYEADQFAAPYASLNPATIASDGIVYDDFGNVTGYTMLSAHPGDLVSMMGPNDYEVMPANRIIHLYRPERPGQQRGIPWVTPALPLCAQMRRFTLAVLAAAENAANVAGLLTSNGTAESFEDNYDNVDIPRNTLMNLPQGYDFKQIKPEQPVTTYEMFKRAIVSEFARCVLMPYGVAAGDSSSYNFASGKLDRKGWGRACRVEHSRLERIVLARVFSMWWTEARLIDGYLPESMRRFKRPPSHLWRWDGDEAIDPQKENSAKATKLSCGLTNLANEIATDGGDWQENMNQRAKEIGYALKLCETNGISPELAPLLYGGVQNIQTAPIGSGDQADV